MKQAEARLLKRAQLYDSDLELQARFRFLTVLIDLRYPIITDVRRLISGTRKKLKALNRQHPTVWLQGAFEFELIDVPAVLTSAKTSRKRQTVSAMIGDNRLSPKLFGSMVLVHFHCLVDLNGTTDASFNRTLRLHFPGIWRVRLQKTRQNQKIEDKCWKIASYFFKDRDRFNFQDNTQGFQLGRQMTDKELVSLAALYDGCSSNGWKHLLIGKKGWKRISHSTKRVVSNNNFYTPRNRNTIDRFDGKFGAENAHLQ